MSTSEQDTTGPTPRTVADAPAKVLAAARALLAKGLVEGTAGNVSARTDDGMVLITPSSLDYGEMALEDLVLISPSGDLVAGQRSPSSEKLLHLACYEAFPEIGSVIHAHPVHATTFAVARRPIPACIDEFTVYVGGEVAVAEYAQSGSRAVGEHAVAVLEDRGAALLANHGMVAIGQDPAQALHIVALVERAAAIALGAMSLGGIEPLPAKAQSDFHAVYDLLRHA